MTYRQIINIEEEHCKILVFREYNIHTNHMIKVITIVMYFCLNMQLHVIMYNATKLIR